MLKKLKSIVPLLVLLNSSNVLSQEVELKYNLHKTDGVTGSIVGAVIPFTAVLKISEENPHTRIEGTSRGEVFGVPLLKVKEKKSFAVVDTTGYPIDFTPKLLSIWKESKEYEVEYHNLMSALYGLINRDLNEDLIYYRIKWSNLEYLIEFRALGDERIPIDDKLLDVTLLEGSVIATFPQKEGFGYKGTVYVRKEKPHYMLKGEMKTDKHSFEGEIDSKSYELLESMLKKSDASSSKKPMFPITIRE